MKIDIHVHTKKTKSGDPETRNINTDRFKRIISDTDVKILAITNHNHFDLKQYQEFQSAVTRQIWPGIELDIDGIKRGHLILIADPDNVSDFNKKILELNIDNPENFSTSIENVVKIFNNIPIVYIAHYNKTASLDEDDIEKLTRSVPDPDLLLKEATNSISAGIFINHGHRSIYGSDIQDWDQYIQASQSLPDLRFSVDSFKQFCLLLKKDAATIQSILDDKSPDTLSISPFKDDNQALEIPIYDDINIIFGSKGTGKTEILKAISKHYNSQGRSNTVYESHEQKLYTIYDIAGKNLTSPLKQNSISLCINEINSLLTSEDKDVTLLTAYKKHFSSHEISKSAQRIKLHHLEEQDSIPQKRQFNSTKNLLTKIINFQTELLPQIQSTIDTQIFTPFHTELKKVISEISKLKDKSFISLHEILLTNSLQQIFSTEMMKKTNKPAKPSTTGFSKYARNRINLEKSIKIILSNISKTIPSDKIPVGELGDKGFLHCTTLFKFHDGEDEFTGYSCFDNDTLKNKKTQKEVSSKLYDIDKSIYTLSLFKEISELSKYNLKSLDDLLIFKKSFTINETDYIPSKGEESMLLLYKELQDDKEIYLLDEPEKSLGNDYINNTIVPIIQNKAKLGKKIIITTHDANIAVRTLPYNSIYRTYEDGIYHTYIGNPFQNLLTDFSGKEKDWKLTSMKTLEGGKNAFGERGKIYGV